MAHVLVVDDDPTIQQLLADILELEGYDTTVVGSGQEALDAVERQQPDAIVLDVMMPGMSGHEVMEKLRERSGVSAIPVLMLTAAAGDDQAWQAWSGGVAYFLGKPFDTAELLRYLDHLLSPPVVNG